jgi:hypothetical protein
MRHAEVLIDWNVVRFCFIVGGVTPVLCVLVIAK